MTTVCCVAVDEGGGGGDNLFHFFFFLCSWTLRRVRFDLSTPRALQGSSPLIGFESTTQQDTRASADSTGGALRSSQPRHAVIARKTCRCAGSYNNSSLFRQGEGVTVSPPCLPQAVHHCCKSARLFCVSINPLTLLLSSLAPPPSRSLCLCDMYGTHPPPPGEHGRAGRDLSSSEAFAASLDLPFDQLELGELIGGGGFGQVR